MTQDPLDLLGRELRQAAERQVASREDAARDSPPRSRAVRRRPQRHRSSARVRVFLAVLAGALGVSAAAWATTTLLSSGDPVGYRSGQAPRPDRQYGTTVPGSVEMLVDNIADPQGGLPWGLRSFRTSRGYGCVQVGRVQAGKLGVLALQDRRGRVTERGLFHELLPAVVQQATTCVPLDGADHSFVALHQLLDQNGTYTQCLAETMAGCQSPEFRLLDFGLLGPKARSITLSQKAGGGTRATSGQAGGYLVVRQESQVRAPAGSSDLGTVPQASALTPLTDALSRVDYRDGTSCRVRVTGSIRGACWPAPGFVPVPQPRVKDVATPVNAAATADRRGVRLRFLARAAVRDGRSAYNVAVHFPSHPCNYRGLSAADRRKYTQTTCAGNIISTDIGRNLAAGTQADLVFHLPNVGLKHRPALGRGRRYRVVITYRTQPPVPRITGSLASPGAKVGEATFRVP